MITLTHALGRRTAPYLDPQAHRTLPAYRGGSAVTARACLPGHSSVTHHGAAAPAIGASRHATRAQETDLSAAGRSQVGLLSQKRLDALEKLLLHRVGNECCVTAASFSKCPLVRQG